MKKLLCLFLLFLFAGCASAEPIRIETGNGNAQVGPDEQNPALHNVKGLIESLPVKYAPLEIKGTCSTKHLTQTYSAAFDHVQGITMIGKNFIISQSTGNLPSRQGKNLLVACDGRNDCSFHLVGSKFPHSGGIQSCGNILAVAIEPRYYQDKHHGKGSEVIFVDFSNPKKPVELPVKIQRPDKYAGAAGIAYHKKHRCHYVVVHDSDVDIYKSNGFSLRDSRCKFNLISSLRSGGATSGGGTNLLYEDTGDLYVAGLNRAKDGREQITLSKIDNPDQSPSIIPVLVKNLSKSDPDGLGKLAAGFRWGGGLIIKNENDIDALAVSRTLCYGSPNNFTKVKAWTKTPWVRIVHNGAYVAKFFLTWTVDGQKKMWKSGKKGVGYDETLVLPDNARDVHLTAQSMTGLLGSKAWKNIIKKEIQPQYTYEVSGTTLHPKYKAR